MIFLFFLSLNLSAQKKSVSIASTRLSAQEVTEINLNIDLNIHGVGGDDTWGSKTMEKYTNSGNKPYHYGFIMEYISKQ